MVFQRVVNVFALPVFRCCGHEHIDHCVGEIPMSSDIHAEKSAAGPRVPVQVKMVTLAQRQTDLYELDSDVSSTDTDINSDVEGPSPAPPSLKSQPSASPSSSPLAVSTNPQTSSPKPVPSSSVLRSNPQPSSPKPRATKAAERFPIRELPPPLPMFESAEKHVFTIYPPKAGAAQPPILFSPRHLIYDPPEPEILYYHPNRAELVRQANRDVRERMKRGNPFRNRIVYDSKDVNPGVGPPPTNFPPPQPSFGTSKEAKSNRGDPNSHIHSPQVSGVVDGQLGLGPLEPYYIPDSPEDCTLVFESRFECGNLRRSLYTFGLPFA